jgi:type I restriction enzyme, S subunit
LTGDVYTHPSYRSTHAGWARPVPEHWRCVRLKDIADRSIHYPLGDGDHGAIKPEHYCDEGIPYLRVQNLGWEFDLQRRGLVHIPSSVHLANGKSRLRPGDILVAKTGATAGKTAIIPESMPEANTTSSVAKLTVNAELARVRYCGYVMRSHVIQDQIWAVASQKSAQPGFDIEDFAVFSIPLPPLPEQDAIVRFLDHTDRRIRRVMVAKQRLIALLNEQRQAVIQHAVTRGLDPSVRTKPSGVSWLGDVPEHWDVGRLKTLCSRVTSGSRGWSEYAADDGPLFLRIGNLTRRSIELDLADVVHLRLPHTAMSEAQRTRVAPNDVLLSITAFIGSVAVAPQSIGEAYVSQHVASCRLKEEAAHPRWVGYVLLSPVGQIHGSLCMYGGTKQGLSLDDVGDYVVLLPPRDEQERLVRKIDADVLLADTAISKARKTIERLREYRTRLIADLVTGECDVREVSNDFSDEVDEPEGFDDLAEAGEDEPELLGAEA